jgi:hypothetical protein
MDIKFNCSNPVCQQRIAVDESMAGQSVPCPACATILQAPSSVNIKFHCSNPDCEQRLVVDVSEAGRFLPCPSCGKPLQVPGAPPKPLVSKIPAQTKAQRLLAGADVEEIILGSPLKRWLCGWGVGVAIFGVLSGAIYLRQKIALPISQPAASAEGTAASLEAMADEIFAVGEFRGAPAANHAGTALVYPRNVKDGGGIFTADITTHQSSLLMTQEEGPSMDFAHNYMFGWSPDDRHLVLPHRVAVNAHNHANHELTICDPRPGSSPQSLALPEEIHEIIWVNTNSLAAVVHSGAFYLVNLATEAPASPAGGKSAKKSAGKSAGKAAVKLELPPLDKSLRHWLTRMSDHSLAYINDGNLWTLDISTGKARQLTQLTGATLEWLDYNPDSGEFLFNLSDVNRSEVLYSLDPNLRSNNLTPVTMRNPSTNGDSRIPLTHVLKAQWVLEGEGIVFVKESLFVEAKDAALSTNLFADGYVQSYSVAPGQNKIYALAAVGAEPMGIWEYDIGRRELRNVVAGADQPPRIARTIPIANKRGGGKNGKGEIICEFLPPANLVAAKKYPAIICSRGGEYWTPDTQLFANAGIFYIHVPTSSNVTNADNLSMEAREMLTAYYTLLNNPNVDPRRIYMMGASHRTEDMTELLTYNPSLWRGAIFEAPVSFPELPSDTSHFPSLFISIGSEDKEEYRKGAEHFTLAAYARNIPARLRYDPGAGHILASTDLLKERYKAMAKFILEGY